MKGRTFRLLVVVALALAATPFAAARAADNPNVVGNSYTSPTYGFSLTWDDSWSVVDLTTDHTRDDIALTNGYGLIAIDAGGGGGDPQACVDSWETSLNGDTGKVANLETVDETGNSPFPDGLADASGGFSYNYTRDDGSTNAVIDSIGCRTLLPGKATLVIMVSTLQDNYSYEAPVAQAVLASLTLPSLGEPEQVFTAGTWRIGLAAAEPAAIIVPKAKLTPGDGKDWLVVVADVTNWSDADQNLPVDAFTLSAAGRPSIPLAPASTLSVAKRMKLGPGHVGSGEAFAARRTERIALVFQIPAGASNLELRFGGQRLSLARTIRDYNGHLPANAAPPPLDEATVVSVIDARTLTVRLTATSAEMTVTLQGIDVPVRSECYANHARSALKKLAAPGSTVRLEREGKMGPPGRVVRDVWIAKDDGTLTLLNGALVAGGNAGSGLSFEEGRFSALIDGAQAAAQVGKTGLWGACTGVHGKASAPSASPSGSPAATPGTTPTPVPNTMLFAPGASASRG